MDFLAQVWDVLTRLDKHVDVWATDMGPWFYALMCLVVFAETGLVVMPFLPGDSLLFALGVLAGRPGSPIDPWIMGGLLMVATLCGDNVNYWVGRRVGPRIFTSEKSRFLNKDHLRKAQVFYEKHGKSTIVIARFIAIIRTFAPFVAGIGRMDYRVFLSYSVFGALIWVWSFLLLGYWLGQTKWVTDNFSLIVWGIMAVTIVLGIWKAIEARREKKRAADG